MSPAGEMARQRRGASEKGRSAQAKGVAVSDMAPSRAVLTLSRYVASVSGRGSCELFRDAHGLLPRHVHAQRSTSLPRQRLRVSDAIYQRSLPRYMRQCVHVRL